MRGTANGIVLMTVLLLITSYAAGRRCVLRKVLAKVEMDGCEPKLVISNACHGSCVSMSVPSFTRNAYENTCSCCKPVHIREKTVEVICGGEPVYISVPETNKCRCRACE